MECFELSIVLSEGRVTHPVLWSQEWQHLQQVEGQNYVNLDRATAMMVCNCMDSSDRDLKGSMIEEGRFFVNVAVLQVHFLFHFHLPLLEQHDLSPLPVLGRRSCPCLE